MTTAADWRLEQMSKWPEKTFQQQVINLARQLGWWSHHHYDSRRSTPGWPDLVLIKDDSALFVELKTEKGRVSPDQKNVLDMLTTAGLDARLWRPRDWASREIHQTLMPEGRY